MLFIVNQLIQTDSTVICVIRMLEHVWYEPFSLEIADLEDICVLSDIHVSKARFKQINKNLRLNVYARMFWEPV